MSLLKADQIRRELFVAYSKQIAEFLGETEDGYPISRDECEEKKRKEEDEVLDAEDGVEEEQQRPAVGEEKEEKGKEKEEKKDGPVALMAERFRISYARQHLLRQRALRLPELCGGPKKKNNNNDGAQRAASSGAGSTATLAAEPLALAAPQEKEEEVEGWRLVYNDPFPSVRRMMRRVQDEALRRLVQESRVPIVPRRDDAYTEQRMSVLQQIEEQVGRERSRLLARQQKMDGKLYQIE